MDELKKSMLKRWLSYMESLWPLYLIETQGSLPNFGGIIEGHGGLEFSMIFHPQIYGKTKRKNQIVKDMLWACVMDFHGNWDKHLPLIDSHTTILPSKYRDDTIWSTIWSKFWFPYLLVWGGEKKIIGAGVGLDNYRKSWLDQEETTNNLKLVEKLNRPKEEKAGVPSGEPHIFEGLAY